MFFLKIEYIACVYVHLNIDVFLLLLFLSINWWSTMHLVPKF